MRKIISIFLTLTLIISSFSFAEEKKEEKIIEKYLGIARIITYTKDDKNIHYTKINGKEQRVDLNGSISFENEYNLKASKRNPSDYKLISVEAFNGTNFKFGADVFGKKIYEQENKNNFFTSQGGFFEDRNKFEWHYKNYSVSNTTINNPNLSNKGVKMNIKVNFGSNGQNYVERQIWDRNYADYLYLLLGGENIDADSKIMIDRLKGLSETELNNQDGYIFFVPYVVTLEKTVKAGEVDLEVVKIITEKEYIAGTKATIPVEVRNNSDKELITKVSFEPEKKEKHIKLPPKSTEIMTFEVNLPDENKNINLIAEINKDRSIVEKDYINNKKSAAIKVVKTLDTSKKSMPCSEKATWSERDFRMETRSYTTVDSKGKTVTRTYTIPVWYTFTYEATLSTTVTVTDDRGEQKNNVTTKSGYGIKIDTASTISIRQVSGKWARSPKQKPSDLTTATATTSWKVKKIHKQPTTITLVSSSKNKFTTPINKSSETKAKVIYTDIDLKSVR